VVIKISDFLRIKPKRATYNAQKQVEREVLTLIFEARRIILLCIECIRNRGFQRLAT
jgi:hypothetical protein